MAHGRSNQDLDALVRRYQRRVHALVFRMTGKHSDQDDLCQEVFLQVIRSLDRVRDETKLDAFVYRIALNVSYDYIRARSKERKASDRLKRQASEAKSEPDGAVAQEAVGEELQQAVRAALAELPADQRAVLVLRTYEGLSHEQIAAIQEVPVETVRWRLFSARRKLETLLSDYLSG